MGNCLPNPRKMVLRAKNEQGKPYGVFRPPKNGPLVTNIYINTRVYFKYINTRGYFKYITLVFTFGLSDAGVLTFYYTLLSEKYRAKESECRQTN